MLSSDNDPRYKVSIFNHVDRKWEEIDIFTDINAAMDCVVILITPIWRQVRIAKKQFGQQEVIFDSLFDGVKR